MIAVFQQVRSPRDVISNDSDDEESDDDDMDIFDMVKCIMSSDFGSTCTLHLPFAFTCM